MGDTIVKITADRDLYVVWSTGTETPTWSGTAAELLEEFGRVEGYCPTCRQYTSLTDTTMARIARADQRGSSSMTGSWWWEYGGEPYRGIYAQLGLVAREHLPSIVELLAGGAAVDDARIRAVLEPLDDEQAGECHD